MTSMLMIYCGCGCGEQLLNKDQRGRIRKHINGHNTPCKGLAKKLYLSKFKNSQMMNEPPFNQIINKSNKIHRNIMELALGRKLLSTEVVHHIDGNRNNNYIGNLMVFKTRKMHYDYHVRTRVYQACGHWDWRKCYICHQYDDTVNMIKQYRHYYHAICHRKQVSEYKRRKILMDKQGPVMKNNTS